MRKPESGKRKPAMTGKVVPKNVDEYLAGIPEAARSTFNELRRVIRSAVPPEASEVISYRIPAFRDKVVLVWFAAFSNHCSLFPSAAVIKAFNHELKRFHTSKGTVHFPLDEPLPAALIKKLVKARVAHVVTRKR
jgi:uncharacterized protein YdhG (YjbR/CyaY superfamily)